MTDAASSLSLFHPLTARWFRECVGVPTDVQASAWPVIARGDHVLITAPTGSGKTLTAFLWAVDRLVTGAWPRGGVRVLYVSPLKALNTDIRRNLVRPLSGLEHLFRESGQPWPEIHVETRSGDTLPSERRRMLHHPPEILITTPESLNLLLSSRSGRAILTSLSTVILDEVHTVVDSKRGVHLVTAVERLVPLSGEFQRIAMSATVRPETTVAEFIAGSRLEGDPPSAAFTPRPVTIVRSEARKSYDLRVVSPEKEAEPRFDDAFWPSLVSEFRRIIGRNRSTLFFARSRRMAEHLALRINAGEPRPVAYAHHGSLARELRQEVEGKLKAGDLKAIVATSSLELGIDIGALDEVVLVQSPPSIAAGVQRIGRAGHRVGATSRGTFVPTHDQDLVESAVLAAAVEEGDIEAVRPVENALDVLAQVLVSMTSTEVWDIDRLYDRVRASWPYRRLGRGQFDLVLQMLAGRYAGTKVRELRPRLSVDAIDGTAAARKGAALDLFISGGTIPDRGTYHLRHEESGALIGELDEEFVWEAKLGQSFSFGTQHWTIRRITHNEVFVLPAGAKDSDAPFWKGEISNRNAHLSDRIAAFLEEADRRLDDPEWRAALEGRYHLDRAAAARVGDYLTRQKAETRAALPHSGHVLVENVRTGPAGYPGIQIIVHTMWGGQLNRPFAMALDAAWEERFGHRLDIFPDDDAIVLQLPHAVPAGELMSLVNEGNLETLLRRRLESSGYFGARFRENAGRALLITRRRLNERLPLWMSRLRSQKLLQAVMKLPDFPILLETWRTCLRDEFDLERLRVKLAGLAAGTIAVSECATSKPSPMAGNLAWRQVNEYMYADSTLPPDARSAVKTDLLRELAFTPGLRPAVSAETVRLFEEKRQRLSPGYAPAPDRDLVDWVKERVVMPLSEWERLLTAVARDHAEAMAAGLPPETAAKILRVKDPGAEGGSSLICSVERFPEVAAAFGWAEDRFPEAEALAGGPATGRKGSITVGQSRLSEADRDAGLTDLLAEALQFYGPRRPGEFAALLGIDLDRLRLGLEDLRDAEAVVEGGLVKNTPGGLVCDADNFASLLRLERAAAAPRVEVKPAADLPLFLAQVQGLVRRPGPAEAAPEDMTYDAVQKLAGYALPAPLWEAEVLPARVPGYKSPMLDFALRQADLRWVGGSGGLVRFTFESDLDILRPDDAPAGKETERGPADIAALFPDPEARYDFGSLLRRAGAGLEKLEDELWAAVWSGQVTNDTWSALRRGLETSFHVGAVIDRQKRALEYAPRRSGLHLSAWREAQAYPGNWLRLPLVPSDAASDLVETEERRKERVRMLLDRYGVLFRELLAREQPPFRWPDVFRTLRIMELSGEVLAGYFFEGVAGPQFISPQALRLFRAGLDHDAVFWVSAVDPASVCGLAVEGLRGVFPKRVEGAHVVFKGNRPVAISQRSGRALTILVPPDDPDLPGFLELFRHLLARDFDPLRRVVIETINDGPAPDSPYLEVFGRLFEVVRDRAQVSLFRTLAV